MSRPYNWRKATPEERREMVKWRGLLGRPWHSPPRMVDNEGTFHLTAACYEHRPVIGASDRRMREFTDALQTTFAGLKEMITAWCVLPNHYHLLTLSQDLKRLCQGLGRLHGWCSHCWNGEEGCRGRRVFFRAADRRIRSEAHFWATVNYIHHNPVRHGYVRRWQDWEFGSARTYLEAVGRVEASRIWRAYPVRDYGKNWDDPGM